MIQLIRRLIARMKRAAIAAGAIRDTTPVLCCPRCGVHFSDWFITKNPRTGEWDRYCYPCSGFGPGPICEDRGIWREKWKAHSELMTGPGLRGITWQQ
jgi:hypothetical protein